MTTVQHLLLLDGKEYYCTRYLGTGVRVPLLAISSMKCVTQVPVACRVHSLYL
jgi:hypothetical protein